VKIKAHITPKLKIFFQVIILGYVINYFLNHISDFEHLLNIDFKWISILFLLCIFSLVPVALEFNYSSKLFNLHLKAKEWIGLSIINTFYNQILPFSSGLFIRAVYLKKKFDLDYSKYSGVMGVSLILNVFTSCVIALLIGLFGPFEVAYLTEISVSLSIILISCVVFYLSVKKLTKIDFRMKFVNDFILSVNEGIDLIQENKKFISTILLLQILMNLGFGLRLFLCFWILDLEVSFLIVIFVQSLTMLTTLISITPGNIGIREAVIGNMQVILGVSFEESVLAATLDRIISLIVIMVFGIYFNFTLIQKELK
jgi:uncharacterized protein (TIRG00374 family)